jgi:C1A family cysteine protease
LLGLSGLQVLPVGEQKASVSKLPSGRLGAPSSLDWRDFNIITPIKDQGSCGDCWAFATVAYAESKLITTDPNYTI